MLSSKLGEACIGKNGWIFGETLKGGRGGHFRSKKLHCKFCADITGNFVHELPGKGGGDQRSFGVSPKIHPFWGIQASLSNRQSLPELFSRYYQGAGATLI